MLQYDNLSKLRLALTRMQFLRETGFALCFDICQIIDRCSPNCAKNGNIKIYSTIHVVQVCLRIAGACNWAKHQYHGLMTDFRVCFEIYQKYIWYWTVVQYHIYKSYSVFRWIFVFDIAIYYNLTFHRCNMMRSAIKQIIKSDAKWNCLHSST